MVDVSICRGNKLTEPARLAEVTTGVLCVSLPELGLFCQKKEKSLPSDSIMRGKYRRDDTVYQGHGSSGRGYSAVASHNMRKLEANPYVELDELEDLQMLGQQSHCSDSRPERRGEVAVTKEVRVDSEAV
jgi:hypothetical protein